jgi:hypothetical protein
VLAISGSAPPSPPSEDFGVSEYSEKVSSGSEGSPAPASPPASSDDLEDSQGLSTVVWTYIHAVERSGLEGSDESEVSSDEETPPACLRSGAATIVLMRVATATTTTVEATTAKAAMTAAVEARAAAAVMATVALVVAEAMTTARPVA